MKDQPASATSRRAFFRDLFGTVAGFGVAALTAHRCRRTTGAAQRRDRGDALATPLVADVCDFGAVGDGKTDDSAAFRAAIESLKGKNGVVRLPSGTTYASGATIEIGPHGRVLVA